MTTEITETDGDRARVIKLIREKMHDKGLNMLSLSKAIGQNDAYIQQFIKKGVPKELSESVRFSIASVLGIDEAHLRIGDQLKLLSFPVPPEPASETTSRPPEPTPRRIFPTLTPAGPTAPAAPAAPPYEPTLGDLVSIPAFLRRAPAQARPAAMQPAPSAETKPASQPLEPVAVPPVSTMPKDVPVLGTAVGGDDAEFEMNGQIIDYVRRPPGIEHARDVFAIFVVGSSMEPRFEEGEMVYVNPKRVPKIGDYVLVELHGKDAGDIGRCLVKRLVKRSSAGLVLEQFNPPRADIQFTAEEVKAVHRIMPWTEVLGM